MREKGGEEPVTLDGDTGGRDENRESSPNKETWYWRILYCPVLLGAFFYLLRTFHDLQEGQELTLGIVLVVGVLLLLHLPLVFLVVQGGNLPAFDKLVRYVIWFVLAVAALFLLAETGLAPGLQRLLPLLFR